MVFGVLAVWGAALRRVPGLWQSLLAVNLAFALLGVVLLAPLPGLVGRGLIHLSGHAALTDQAIAQALLTPFGLAALVLVLGILVAITALTQAALMFIVLTGGTARPAIAFALRRAPVVLLFSWKLVVRVLARALPFLGLAALIAWALLTAHDINWYLSARPPVFWLAAVLIALVLAAMVWVVLRRLAGWALALPLVLFAGVCTWGAFAESERLTLGQRPLVLGLYLIWTLFGLVIGAFVLWLVQSAGDLVVPHLFHSLSLLALVLGALVAAWALLNLVVTAIDAAGFALLTIELARRLGAPLSVGPAVADAAPLRPTRGRLTPRRAAGLLVAAAVIAALTGVWLIEGVSVRDQTLVVAHRGASGRAPENTLAAVRAAIADGADWIEIDVQETKDGAVIVTHDSDFMKLAGNPLRVWDGTLAEIQSIDVGAWFGPAFKGERVPTLREVLDTARGHAKVFIELKYYGHEQQLEQRVVEIVEAASMTDAVAIMSLKYTGVQRLRALRPDWRLGLLAAKALGNVSRREVDFLAVNRAMVKGRLLREAQAAGQPVFVWTVNDPLTLSRMLSRGVAGVITDEPALARQVIAERAAMDPVERALLRLALLFGQPMPTHAYRDASP